MKRLRITGIVVGTLLAVLVPAQAVMAATTATVTITATPGKVSITVAPTSYDFQTLAYNPDDPWYYTKPTGPGSITTDPMPLEDAECFATVTNDGNVNVDVRAKMSNLTGGTPTWTLGNAPGNNTYTMYIAASGATSWGSPLQGDYTNTYFITNLGYTAPNNTKKFALRVGVPTNESAFEDTTQKSGTLTLQAKKA